MIQKSCLLSLVFFFGISTPLHAYEIVAFKGLHQSIRRDVQISNDACTAGLVNIENHPFVENTIPAIQAAFDLGATIGHFNIQATSDGKIAAFHDARLECKTDGSGLVQDHTTAALKKLDPGYGYTWDHGKTFPLRSKWVGAIPVFNEIVDTFPGRQFVINNKNRDPGTVNALAHALSSYPHTVQRLFFYTGANESDVRRLLPGMQIIIDKERMKQCLYWWISTGWSGYVHPSCKNTTLVVPVGVLRKGKFLAQAFSRFAKRAGSSFWILEVDSEADARFAKELGPDFIGTYRIDRTIGILSSQ